MSSPVRSLLSAADRYPRRGAPENRLTEIFAEVLRTSPRLCAWLAQIAFPELTAPAATTATVSTQFQLAGGTQRPDIRVVLGDGHTFYVEDKIDAESTAAQVAGYSATHDAPVVVVARQQRADLPHFKQRTWADVAHEIRQIGTESASRADSGWPAYAWTAQAPSEVRMLAELASYLERELQVTSQAALTTADLENLRAAQGTVSRWEGLFTLIEAQLAEHPGTRGDTLRMDADGHPGPLWRHRHLGSEAWSGWNLLLRPDKHEDGWPVLLALWELSENAPPLEDRFVVATLLMAPAASWDPGDAEDGPAIGVGMTVAYTNGWPVGLRENEDLRATAERAGFRLHVTGGDRGRIFRTRRLAEFGEHLALEDQADEIGRWARETLEEFTTLGA